MDKLNTVLLLALVGLVGISVFTSSRVEMETVNPIGSVSVSNEYESVHMGDISIGDFGFATGTALKTGQGVLGSVTIMSSAAGVITIYNATTSDATQRALATSSLEILALIPASLAVGTYTYDILADIGIMVDVTTIQPTAVITFR